MESDAQSWFVRRRSAREMPYLRATPASESVGRTWMGGGRVGSACVCGRVMRRHRYDSLRAAPTPTATYAVCWAVGHARRRETASELPQWRKLGGGTSAHTCATPEFPGRLQDVMHTAHLMHDDQHLPVQTARLPMGLLPVPALPPAVRRIVQTEHAPHRRPRIMIERNGAARRNARRPQRMLARVLPRPPPIPTPTPTDPAAQTDPQAQAHAHAVVVQRASARVGGRRGRSALPSPPLVVRPRTASRRVRPVPSLRGRRLAAPYRRAERLRRGLGRARAGCGVRVGGAPDGVQVAAAQRMVVVCVQYRRRHQPRLGLMLLCFRVVDFVSS
ncbi:hypothetical protein C2E23DRAFT_845866 [Lenzites betulinus]|nr:hypothetical protein C2E23DRAFT_845866 [Lenzites betulinus]